MAWVLEKVKTCDDVLLFEGRNLESIVKEEEWSVGAKTKNY